MLFPIFCSQDVIRESQDLSSQIRPFIMTDTNSHEENEQSPDSDPKVHSPDKTPTSMEETRVKPLDATDEHCEKDRRQHRNSNITAQDNRSLGHFAWSAFSYELDSWINETAEFREWILFSYELAERVDARTMVSKLFFNDLIFFCTSDWKF